MRGKTPAPLDAGQRAFLRAAARLAEVEKLRADAKPVRGRGRPPLSPAERERRVEQRAERAAADAQRIAELPERNAARAAERAAERIAARQRWLAIKNTDVEARKAAVLKMLSEGVAR